VLFFSFVLPDAKMITRLLIQLYRHSKVYRSFGDLSTAIYKLESVQFRRCFWGNMWGLKPELKLIYSKICVTRSTDAILIWPISR